MERPGRKKELIFLAACLITVVVVFTSMRDRKVPAGHVYMEDGKTMLDGEPYYPMVLNYIVNLQTNGQEIWPSAYQGYTPGYRFPFSDRDSALLQIRADFMLMRALGFNAVRIVKLAEGPVRDRLSGELFVKAFISDTKDTLLQLQDEHVYTQYLFAIQEVLRTAREVDMKVILLTSLHPGHEDLEEEWKKLAENFQDEPAILAYDLFNEPLYFDSLERSKREVYDIVRGWRKMVRKHAPHHLFTIGLQGIRETFTWDPNILDVDFISFHPYEYETEQVRNELFWYHDQVDVPWIIGETSLPADNDSIPYQEQLGFARKVLQQTRNCGGSGFSWWQYKDVPWGDFHSDHMGLLSLSGETSATGAPVPIPGTPKPTVQAFQEFDPAAPQGECLQLPNYANYSGHSTSMLTGKLLDVSGEPIAGGVVIAWNEHWSRSYHTVTDHNGEFQLKGDFYFHHWMATATRHSWVRGDCFPNAFLTREGGIPEFYLGELKVERYTFADHLVHPSKVVW